MIIGVTGKYCAGKTLASKVFAKRGFTHISVDALGHEAITHYTEALIKEFGEQIESQDGGINRRALGTIVFAKKERLEMLEHMVHPWMVQRVYALTKDAHANMLETTDANSNANSNTNTNANYIIDATLLHHMKLDVLCSLILIIHAPFLIRFFRALKRDKLHPLQVLRRFRNQRHIPDKHHLKKSLNKAHNSAEQIVSSSCSATDFELKLDEIIKEVEHGKESKQ